VCRQPPLEHDHLLQSGPVAGERDGIRPGVLRVMLCLPVFPFFVRLRLVILEGEDMLFSLFGKVVPVRQVSEPVPADVVEVEAVLGVLDEASVLPHPGVFVFPDVGQAAVGCCSVVCGYVGFEEVESVGFAGFSESSFRTPSAASAIILSFAAVFSFSVVIWSPRYLIICVKARIWNDVFCIRQ